MVDIFINLKRFDIPRALGGLCPVDDPVAWIRSVLADTRTGVLADRDDLRLVYFLPEGLLTAARSALLSGPEPGELAVAIGCQGVHWADVAPGVNFGAMTSLVPASAAWALGASWAIIGHSEERRAKLQVIAAYDPAAEDDPTAAERAAQAVDDLIGREVEQALAAGLNVLFCLGETEAQRGESGAEALSPGAEQALHAQLVRSLGGAGWSEGSPSLVAAYEPVWAIGPGRVPPGRAYIEQAASLIQRTASAEFGRRLPVVYGGGLKRENAAMIGSIEALSGGLVALTRFEGDIGFDVDGLEQIALTYLGGTGGRA